MEVVIHKLARLRARKRVHIILGCLFLALAITITGVYAWAKYTGVIGEGEITNPGKPKDNSKNGFMYLYPLPNDPTGEGSPFSNDGEPIKNPNQFPVVLRVSLKEIFTEYTTLESYTLDVPSSWKPVVLNEDICQLFMWHFSEGKEDPFTDGKEVPFDSILWNEDLLGPKPANLHIKYRPTTYGYFDYLIYLEITDADGNFVGIQIVYGLDGMVKIHMLDAATIGTLWFADYAPTLRPVYFFYDDSEICLSP